MFGVFQFGESFFAQAGTCVEAPPTPPAPSAGGAGRVRIRGDWTYRPEFPVLHRPPLKERARKRPVPVGAEVLVLGPERLWLDAGELRMAGETRAWVLPGYLNVRGGFLQSRGRARLELDNPDYLLIAGGRPELGSEFDDSEVLLGALALMMSD